MIIRVYKITNLINGKVYVGITSKTVESRWSDHKRWANYAKAKYIHRAIKKYGSKNFQVEQIGYCRSRKAAAKRERKLIKEYGTLAPYGYNLSSGGEKNVGFTFVVEVREKQRQGRLGKKHTPEARARMSKAKKGKSLPIETRKKMSESHKGLKWSKLQRKKITATQQTSEYRAKMSWSGGLKLAPLSKEHRKKIQKAAIQNWKDPEYRARFEAGMREWRQSQSRSII